MTYRGQQEEIILGVDPGSRITGYGVIMKKGSCYEVLRYGVIAVTEELSSAEKYHEIFQKIGGVMEEQPLLTVAVENQFMGKNAQSMLKLGMAKAAVMIAAVQRGISVCEYAPSEIKLSVTGNGRASKAQIEKMVRLLLHLPPPSIAEDTADALAIALCHTIRRRRVIR